MTTKYTKRDYFSNLISFVTTGSCEISNDELVAFCETQNALLDKRAEKARAAAAAKKTEGDALTDAVLAAMTDEPQTITEIVAALNDENVTAAKVTYRLGQLFNAEKIVKGEMTVKAEGHKPRKLVTYKLA